MQDTLSVGSFINFGWETFKKRPWFLIGATIVYVVASWYISFVSSFVGGFLAVFLGSGIAGLSSFVVSTALGMLIAMGWLAFLIKVHDDPASAALSKILELSRDDHPPLHHRRRRVYPLYHSGIHGPDRFFLCPVFRHR